MEEFILVCYLLGSAIALLFLIHLDFRRVHDDMKTIESALSQILYNNMAAEERRKMEEWGEPKAEKNEEMKK